MLNLRVSNLLLLACSGIIFNAEAFVDPLSLAGVAITGYFAGQYYKRCDVPNYRPENVAKVPESVNNQRNVPDDFIGDFNGLSGDFLNLLHGQHLASHMVLRSLKSHIFNESPKKALVMSFHGPPGTGKNFVSSLIAKRLFRNGIDSNCVTLWIGKLDFPHSSMEERYFNKIQETIEAKVNKCPRALFIIDEMDNMANGIIDALKPYIDYHEQVDEVDYRKAAFIFISNIGSEKITNISYEKLKGSEKREDIKLKDFKDLLETDAFNEKGGFHKSNVIGNRLIDIFIPFLPLEKSQVKECIGDLLFEKRCFGVTDSDIENVADQLLYNLGGYTIFSKDGCKNLEIKIAVMLDKPCGQNKGN